MLTVASAEKLILERMPHFGCETVPIDDARGAILREIVTAERDQPPYDRVTMDGIAIKHDAWVNGCRSFRMQGTQAAGEPARPLTDPQHCVEVMTGAVLAPGADAVIPIEQLKLEDGSAIVKHDYVVQERQYVHHQGSDQLRGQPLLEPGVLIRGPEMALLVAAGRPEVKVNRWPRIAVISNGDELVDVGQPISDFQVRSCNDRAISAALTQRGFRYVTRAVLPDDPKLLEKRIGELHTGHDVLILSGGVSMGKFDYIPAIMEALGIDLVFHKISQRPGLPMWFGISDGDKSVFALPGNPVSSLVCLIRYVVTGLNHGIGRNPEKPLWTVLSEPVEFLPELTYFVPVVLDPGDDGRVRARPKPTNTSGDFVSLAGTDGFVELERERKQFASGHRARFFAW